VSSEHWIDHLSKSLLRGASRRRVLEGVSALSTALLLNAPRDSDAKGRKKRRKEKGGKGGKGGSGGKTPADPIPEPPDPCDGRCGNGLTCCDGLCVDLFEDRDNCDACGHFCPYGEKCVSGKCVCKADGNHEICNGRCIETANDSENCGGCGKKCDAWESCRNSECRHPECFLKDTKACLYQTGAGPVLACIPVEDHCCDGYSCPSWSACCGNVTCASHDGSCS
jgi:hypothetical protein